MIVIQVEIIEIDGNSWVLMFKNQIFDREDWNSS